MELDLTQFGLERSTKVIWRFPVDDQDPLNHFRSKGLRKFLQKSAELLEKIGITWKYEALTREAFLNWLPYYQEKMTEQGYDLLATPEWYDSRTGMGRTVEGMFFYQNGKMVGSGIFTVEGNEKAVFSFKASDRIDLDNTSNSSLGAVIDYLFLQKMSEKKIAIISAGQSRNAFGVVNTLGYLDYKLRFGYNPQLPKTPEMTTTIPVNDDGVVAFFAQPKEGVAGIYLCKPKGKDFHFEVAHYHSPELPFTTLEYDPV